ncbi:uncharacterized protein BXZ73DRAFT_100664 [Epithele typhae]|uniref:uncharacterized protein n=1 Tax=Epithele typhae TaxID=378194 RepID=UPI0020085A4C|nr:uncharacterized protein BXZ73DRAFT_100664 [Epithele typhae]KAH9934472.1 hypothetical protein BXZ73DRAFT_100664 [Epithele typhae]
MSSGEDYSALVADASGILIENYCTLSTSVLILYEHFVTLGDEVQLFWSHNSASAVVLFLANRYFALGYYTYLLVLEFCPLSIYNGSEFGNLSRAQSILAVVPYVIRSTFSGMRTFAVSRSRPLAAVVFSPSMAPFCTNIYDVTEFSHVLVFSRAPVMVADLIVIVITWYKLGSYHETSVIRRTSFTDVLLRDGTIYFVVLFALNAVHLALTLRSIGTFSESPSVITSFTDPLTAVLVSRFMLHIRSVQRQAAGVASGDDDTINPVPDSGSFGVDIDRQLAALDPENVEEAAA